ncbi:glycosyltransferase family 2 protein [Campylobacter sp.]|uniref:glycosyltransferase family 2 protein n=1 Tax=Campylobacter sp. TaxID=205 RepID=UPI0025C57EB0|nr:glycosyltransferase family 2 protein [Campylobacter sp.]
MNKKVGVVIPIYNVEKYLRECLDSVINQTYKNLEVVLVNDGSTDENSLNIAKEYTLKDERFILFDKENGGQSTARNVGIEYFSGEYKLKNITTQINKNSLIEFELSDSNPYNIYKAYKSPKAFNNEKDLTNFSYPIIDYIIFLDSDDYWELNCIEECVPRMEGVEIVWFDERKRYEIACKNESQDSRLKDINIKSEKKISLFEWLQYLIRSNMKDFSFVYNGMIDFKFLKNIKLYFLNGIFAEDHLFGILLFAQAKYVYIYPKALYCYRIRANSSTNQDKKITAENIPPHLKIIYDAFDKDAYLTKEYFKAYSWVVIALEIVKFINNYQDKNIVLLLKNIILRFYVKNAFKINKFKKDPLCAKESLKLLKSYKISKIKYVMIRLFLSFKYKK